MPFTTLDLFKFDKKFCFVEHETENKPENFNTEDMLKFVLSDCTISNIFFSIFR